MDDLQALLWQKVEEVAKATNERDRLLALLATLPLLNPDLWAQFLSNIH